MVLSTVPKFDFHMLLCKKPLCRITNCAMMLPLSIDTHADFVDQYGVLVQIRNVSVLFDGPS
jgi:hypothetical protein